MGRPPVLFPSIQETGMTDKQERKPPNRKPETTQERDERIDSYNRLKRQLQDPHRWGFNHDGTLRFPTE